MKHLKAFLALTLLAGVAAQSAAQAGAPLRLSLQQAVELALAPQGDARLQVAAQAVKQAQARAGQSRAGLLPTLEGSTNAQNLTRSLSAGGIIVNIPLPGFAFPDLVGPYTLFDFRSAVSQNILDLGVLKRYQAAKSGVTAAEAERNNVGDQVATQTARFYLAAWRSDAALEAVRANVTLAEALLRRATERQDAGKGIAIEVTRAQVQLANDRQRLLAAETERNHAYRQLLKILRLKLDTPVELTSRPDPAAPEVPALEPALATALDSRADLKVLHSRQEIARRNLDAVRMERYPSLSGFADYGAIGTSVAHTLPTRTVGLSLRVPLFDGGAREARRAESMATSRQEEIREKDLREQVELEVRQALDALHSAAEQMKVAKEGLDLAESEVAQAQRRTEGGVALSVELTDAQTRLARARDNQVLAVYNYQQARVDFGEATGTIRALIQSMP
jgi:outer membrane protein TolC